LHEALREVLGAHVEQRGSYVSPEALRFDFSHFQKVTDSELRRIEQSVGEKIRADYALEEERSLPIAQAKAMGALALFGEKYGEEVRVVKYGSSVELCGGTHVPSTGRLGALRIIAESSVAAGVRRIEAVTAEGAEEYFFRQQDAARKLRALLNNAPSPVQAVQRIVEENAALKKQAEAFEKEKAGRIKKELLAGAVERNGVTLFKYIGEGQPDTLKDVAFQIRSERKDNFVVVAGIAGMPKCTLMLMLSDGLTAKGFNAAALVKDAAKHIQGGGGGQPHFATAGGTNGNGLAAAVDSILEKIGIFAE
jgi:alanyl-tRNA synthetase